MAHRTRLDSLPQELTLMIFSNLDIHSFRALANTSPVFRSISIRHHATITHRITQNALGDLMPFAIAVYAASRADWKAQWPLPGYDELKGNILQFGEQYLIRTQEASAIRLPDFTFSMALEMINFHSIIEEWTSAYLEWSMDQASQNDIQRSPFTATEIKRVQLTLYAMEISRELLPFDIIHGDIVEILWDMFWHYFSPWENQLAWDIDDFLRDTIRKAYLPPGFTQQLADAAEWLVTRWLSKFGLRSLSILGDLPTLITSFDDLEDDLDLRDLPFRPARYCATDFTGCTWLRPVGGDVMIRSFDIAHVLARFPEEERGPCNTWLFQIASEVLPEDLNRLPAKYSTAWWDLTRVHAAFPDTVPGIDELQVMAQNEEYESGAYTFTTDPDYCRETGYY
ncbi:hypothetical protein F5Y13DRAFT_188875 [Hypoxylon sp. FL1857]|nr:hypothetical protein F5Y13DRAFT_188875 [Hypoxylon sp. FL1857]